MEGKDFTNVWRRTRACQRCSRLKVKCVYESPESPACLRCSKSSIDCLVSNEPNNQRTRRALVESRRRARLAREGESGGSPTAAVAAGAEATRAQRIAQLQATVAAATAELRELQPHHDASRIESGGSGAATSAAAHDAVPGVVGVPTTPKCGLWDVGVFYKRSLVQAVIDAGLITLDQAQAAYAHIAGAMRVWISFRVPTEYDDTNQPMLSLAIVVCGATQLPAGALHMDRLVEFFERALAERTVMRSEFSLELVKCLFMLCMFLHPRPYLREKLYFMGWAAMATELGLGSLADVRCIIAANANSSSSHPRLPPLQSTLPFISRRPLQSTKASEEPEVSDDGPAALERAQLFSSVYLSIIAATIFVSNRPYSYLRHVIPDGAATMDVLFSSGTHLDRIIVYTTRILLVGKECSDLLRTHLTVPQTSHSINTMREEYRGRISEIYHSLKLFVELNPAYTSHLVIPCMCYYSMLSMIDEHIINYYVFGDAKAKRDELLHLSYDMATGSRRLIDNFVDASHSTASYLKYIFFSPLHGLACLLRLRLVLWTQRESIELGVDIEREFERVKAAWAHMRKRYYVATQMQDMLDELESFVKLKLGRGPEESTLELRMINGCYMTNIDMLHAIIQRMVYPGSSSNHDASATPASSSVAATTPSTATTASAASPPSRLPLPIVQQPDYIPAVSTTNSQPQDAMGMLSFNQSDDIEALLKGLFNEVPGFLD
ncbi:hypothetical protein TRVA0_007S03950 [Trichomonascus vanleenenianus]|uniref:Zn(II)2Cys6 transcription factor domain-containing protein n=1 Tax=Trichomonascus vanleenenianus TaxID=2268995 RepID=UPI003ECA0072